MTTTTKERPILFSAPMVRAILSGAKTQTRRVVKFPAWMQDADGGQSPEIPHQFDGYQDMIPVTAGHVESYCRCPYGKPGQRLWVRETWAPVSTFDPSPETGAFYRADYLDDPHGPDGEKSPEGRYRTWKPSIYMPRWASRIDIEITGVRVERLQEISPEDAIAEGCCPSQGSGFDDADTLRRAAEIVGGPYPRGVFADLWQSINGPDSWAANPWVWVIEFRRIGGVS